MCNFVDAIKFIKYKMSRKLKIILCVSIVLLLLFCVFLYFIIPKENTWEVRFVENKFNTTVTSTKDVLRYNYTKLLDSSLLFFESMRSGELPSDNHVSWRGDSCLDCRGPRGEDLTGGYYDNGASLGKSFLQNALVTTFLALNFNSSAYAELGFEQRVREQVAWGADYLMNYRTGDTVCELTTTGSYWGRPEEATNASRSVKVLKPSQFENETDTIFAVSAALAASSILFKNINKTRSSEYQKEAEELYKMATNISGASSTDIDFEVWATYWIQRSRNENSDFEEANKKEFREKYNIIRKRKPDSIEHSQIKFALQGKAYTLLEFDRPSTCEDFFKDKKDFEYSRITHGSYEYYGFSAAIRVLEICLALGEEVFELENKPNPHLKKVIRHVNMMLGNASRSFVTGFGHNPPLKAAHMASSCPKLPLPCDGEQRISEGPNPQKLPGALVYGPDMNGTYIDSRDYRDNTVDIATNAAFQNVIARLLKIHLTKKLPKETYLCKYTFQTEALEFEIAID